LFRTDDAYPTRRLVGQRFNVTRYGEGRSDKRDHYFRLKSEAGSFIIGFSASKPGTTASYGSWSEDDFGYDHEVLWRSGRRVTVIKYKEAFVAPFSGPLDGISFEIVGCWQ